MPSDWKKRWFAAMLARVSPLHERHIAARKARLFEQLPDRAAVVEIGPGTGVNFHYLRNNVRWIGVEPNPHLHARLRDAAAKTGHQTAELHALEGELLPLPDASADAVIATLVLCSVRDPKSVLAESLRVLKPGGRYVFVEHVAAPPETTKRRMQNGIQPVWTWLADGCHPNRETLAMIRAAGFESVHAEEFHTPMGLFSPHIAGWANKRR